MCLWMPVACVCVRACVGIYISLRLPYLVFSIRSYLPLDFNRLSSLRPTYHHPFGRPSTYSLFRGVSRLGTGSGTRCCGSTGGTAVHMEQKTRSKFLPPPLYIYIYKYIYIYIYNTKIYIYIYTTGGFTYRWAPQFPAARGFSSRAAEFEFLLRNCAAKLGHGIRLFAAEFDVFHSNNYFFTENDLKVAL